MPSRFHQSVCKDKQKLYLVRYHERKPVSIGELQRFLNTTILIGYDRRTARNYWNLAYGRDVNSWPKGSLSKDR